MKFFDYLRPWSASKALARPRAQASEGIAFSGLDDPKLLQFIRTGMVAAGASSLRNMAVLRCLTLISSSVAMLPLNLQHNTPERPLAKAHAAYRLTKLKPNGFQTPFEFKQLMQFNVLRKGNAYARVVWSGERPIHMVPMDPDRTRSRLTDSWDMVYDYTRPDGQQITLPSREVLHLRDISLDGIDGLSRLKLAQGVIDLANQAETAATRTFRTGVMAGGAIEAPAALSDQAYQRMKDSLESAYTGAENAGKWMLLEENAKANRWSNTAKDAQQIESRDHQIEEVARAFGVPRPLLMMDDTSWGSGIEQLAIFFIQYTLAPWFICWEQALARVLLSEREIEQEDLQFKFNERALLRGTLKDQADFFAKALGAGGHAPWMSQNEVRDLSDLPRSKDPNADQLRNPMTQKPTEKSA
jgi:HK97 family phage portal protein